MAAIQNIQKQLSTWKTQGLRPAVLGSMLVSGVLIYFLEVILVISFGALIFSGSLASQLPQALSLILAGNAVLLVVIALLSSYPGSTGVSQDTSGVVIALVAASIATSLAGDPRQQFATVMVMIAMTTLVTGLLFLALGVFKLGGLARFLPYPVMGGFLAGTGWLLAEGGVSIMVGTPLGPGWLDPQQLFHWLPGAALAVAIYAVLSRVGGSFILPLFLLSATAVFYAVAAVANVSFAQLDAGGWLVGSMPSGSTWQYPLSLEFLQQVNWGALGGQIPNLAPVAIISVLALLLNCSGLELVANRDMSLNRELIAAGVGNLAGGALGGLVGYHAISLSALNHKMTGGRRPVALVAGALIVATIFAGTSVFSYIPKMILGAVLVFLGIGLLVEWIYQAWFKFPLVDFLIVMSILVVIMFSSFLSGVVLGLILATIMFVVSYSRVGIVRYALRGGEYRSRVIRSVQQQQILQTQGDQLYILKLHGFIFFGTANGILDQLRAQVSSNRPLAIRFVVLDFREVTGLDSTALLCFSRMVQWAQEQGILLVMTGLEGRAREQFFRGGFQEQPGRLYFFPDLDRGVEWCESEIIAGGSTNTPAGSDIISELRAIVGENSGIEKLLPYMHRREYAAGEYLIRQGDEPDEMYFVESGQVTTVLETPGHAPVRLETTSGGCSVGELGFYLGIKRTASVIADEDSVIYSLSRQELANIEKLDSEAANLLHRAVVHLLGERVVRLTRAVDALER